MTSESFPPPSKAPVDWQIVEENIALVTINRPEAMNAITGEITVKLGAALAELDQDPNVRAIILTGTGGKAFCSGADLREVARGGLNDMFTWGGGFAGFVHAARRKPWIAAVDGYALAGGFEIVLACDLAFATPPSRFGLPEVRRGLLASAGGAYRLPRALPPKVAAELILTGGSIDAERALSLGLINAVARERDLFAAALQTAREIASNAPLAVQESLAILQVARDRSDAELKTLSDRAQARLQQSTDYVEGATAFYQKRLPVWTGK